MIQVTICKNQNGLYTGFECLGHAEYADAGKDIVCAGVSVLVINTMNAIECFTGEKFTTNSDKETGKLIVRLKKPAGHDTELLINSLVLGLQGIQDDYGVEYITLKFKEV